MKIFTNEDIRKIDRYTIDEEGVAAHDLIQRVAEGVVAEIAAIWRTNKPIAVFAGPGNNGADALAVALLLYQQGYRPKVYLFNIRGNSLSRECKRCRDELLASGFNNLVEITESMDHPELGQDYLVVDGLFGSGLRSGGLAGGYKMLVRDINESKAFVVSIDIPSGLYADWNPSLIDRDVVHANITFAVQFPRISFMLADKADIVGTVKILDIGLSQKAARDIKSKYYLVEMSDVRRVLKQRHVASSKDNYGHGCIFAGSYGKVGAAVLAARGALRSGIGKLTVHGPRCAFNILQTAIPDAMFQPDPKDIFIGEMSIPSKYNALGVGPGLGINEQTINALDTLLKGWAGPLVIDADGLNAIASRPSMLQLMGPKTVITPHAGEFDRIFGTHVNHEARLIKAIEMSRQYRMVIVLKGYHTAIVRPDGKVFFNSTGNPGMATGGSGDVLTGVITSFMAQGLSPEVASIIGVFVHGLAGDIAAEDKGQYGMTADDIASALPIALKQIVNN